MLLTLSLRPKAAKLYDQFSQLQDRASTQLIGQNHTRTQQVEQAGHGAKKGTAATLNHEFQRVALSGRMAHRDVNQKPPGGMEGDQPEADSHQIRRKPAPHGTPKLIGCDNASRPGGEEATHQNADAARQSELETVWGRQAMGQSDRMTKTEPDHSPCRTSYALPSAPRDQTLHANERNANASDHDGQVKTLHTGMLNRRNQCCLNAVVACLYQLQSCELGSFGSVDRAIREVTQQQEVEILQSQAWRPLLRSYT